MDHHYDTKDSISRVPPSSSSTFTALDGLVNVNSCFAIALFFGISFTTLGQHSLENRSSCDAAIDVAKKLLVVMIVSFSCFLFSLLVAQGLKIASNFVTIKDVNEASRAHINVKILRFGMLVSAIGSGIGCIFMVFSVVSLIEIRLGMFSCVANLQFML